MKRKELLTATVGAFMALCLDCVSVGASLPPVVVTSISASNSLVVLHWTGGRPTYQIQASSELSGPWTNIGVATTNTTAMIPTGGAQAFFRVAQDYTAQYRVDFDATWSQATLPTNWPGSSAHFSGLVGGTHNGSVHFWRDGEAASEGIRLMAELGQKTTLLNEIAPAIASGNAQLQLSGGGISPSPGNVSLVFPQPMSRDFPLVTLVSMIAPSPDWFVGVDSLNLIEGEEWVTNMVVTLYGRDAGTDSGVTFTSPDEVTAPRGVVTPFTGFPAIQDGVIVPFGTFTFTRLD